MNCGRLQYCRIGWASQIKYIYRSAFENCRYLSSIDFDFPSVESIEDKAFSGCTSLTALTLPAGVRLYYTQFDDQGKEIKVFPEEDCIPFRGCTALTLYCTYRLPALLL